MVFNQANDPKNSVEFGSDRGGVGLRIRLHQSIFEACLGGVLAPPMPAPAVPFAGAGEAPVGYAAYLCPLLLGTLCVLLSMQFMAIFPLESEASPDFINIRGQAHRLGGWPAGLPRSAPILRAWLPFRSAVAFIGGRVRRLGGCPAMPLCPMAP